MAKFSLRTGISVALACLALGNWTGFASTQANQTAAFQNGRRLADETLAALEEADGFALLANAKLLGYIVAEGDSWFDYPGMDVLDAMGRQRLPQREHYRIFSAANAGDTVESMAYDARQREGFAAEFRKIADLKQSSQVSAILLSGGGNDIAGDEFSVLLNHAASGALTAVDSTITDAFIERVAIGLESLIGIAAGFASQILGRTDIPILIHGYSPPVPDGRPFLFGLFLPGPWLKPGFSTKGYVLGETGELAQNTAIMADIIARFHRRVSAIPDKFKAVADVRYVDLSSTLSNVVGAEAYKTDWANELHPVKEAFIRVATAFHNRIQNK